MAEHIGQYGDRYHLGLRPRPHDPRELRYRLTAPATVDLTTPRSLAQWLPPVMDQGQMGSCVSNATVGAAMTLGRKAGFETVPELDRLWLYYQSRVKEGTFPQDAGSYPADACDIAMTGLPPEVAEAGGYVADPAKVPAPDPQYGVYDYVLSHRPFYATDPGGFLAGLVTALDAGMPVLVAMGWHRLFWAQDGVLPDLVPESGEGGHCVYAWGYQPDSPRGPLAWCRNSWGLNWTKGEVTRTWSEAQPGDFALPLGLLTNGTVWEMRAVSGEKAPDPTPTPTPVDGYARAIDVAAAEFKRLDALMDRNPRSAKAKYTAAGAGSVVNALVKAKG